MCRFSIETSPGFRYSGIKLLILYSIHKVLLPIADSVLWELYLRLDVVRRMYTVRM
jgi:hypothetical protein